MALKFYQQINNLGYSPEECINKKVLSVFKSESGYLGVGVLGNMIVSESEDEEFFILGNIFMKYEFLGMIPEYLLEVIREIHDKAKERGIDINDHISNF